MSVLDRSELEASSLADLHAIADQLGLDGFRRLRKADLIDAILGEPAKDGNGSDARGDSADGGADAERPATETASPNVALGADRAVTAWRRALANVALRACGAAPRPVMIGRAREGAGLPLAVSPRAPRPHRHLRRLPHPAAVAARERARAAMAAAAPRSRTAAPGARPSRIPPTRVASMALAAPRAWSSCSATARPSCASIRRSPPTTTSTSPPRRSAAASSSPATG